MQGIVEQLGRAGSRRMAMVAGLMLVSAARIAAQQAAPEPKREIVVSIPDRKLAILEDGKVVKQFDVAIGKAETPTPVGEFTIVNRLENPTYYGKGKVIPPGPANPLGARWLGLSAKSFGIHGTNEPDSIGQAASSGCVRMRKADLLALFKLMRVNDVVRIRGERDELVATIFGPASPIVQLAQAAPSNPTARENRAE